MPVARHLVRSDPGPGTSSPWMRRTASVPVRPCSGRGLPGRPVARPPVGSYPTISPLPRPVRSRLCPFCGTLLRVTPTGRYPAPCSVESGLSSGGGPPAAVRPACAPSVRRPPSARRRRGAAAGRVAPTRFRFCERGSTTANNPTGTIHQRGPIPPSERWSATGSVGGGGACVPIELRTSVLIDALNSPVYASRPWWCEVVRSGECDDEVPDRTGLRPRAGDGG